MTVEEILDRARARIRRHAPAQALELVTGGALLVDIRPVELRVEHGEIADALVIDRNVLEWRLDPASSWRVPQATSLDRPVILFCQAGYASSLAAASLVDLGYRHAADIDGGFEAWRAQGLPVRRVSKLR